MNTVLSPIPGTNVSMDPFQRADVAAAGGGQRGMKMHWETLANGVISVGTKFIA